jgi:hypothetical protein
MRYTLLLHYPEPDPGEMDPQMLAEGMRAFQKYANALEQAGILQSAEVLQPSNATVSSWSKKVRSLIPKNNSVERL